MDNNPILTVMSTISQGALWPVVICLIAMLVITLVLVIMAIVEFFTERRHFKAPIAQVIRQIEQADCQSIPGIIAGAELVKRQKLALMQVFNSRDLPQEARWNVAKRAVYVCGEHYRRREAVAELLAKIAPMLGLMGTLIPLGPGLQALSEGNIGNLASALTVAFDTTVMGLISAAVCLIVVRVRQRWSADYANALDAMTGALFDHLADLEEAGDLEYKVPEYELAADDDAAHKKEAKTAARAKRKAERDEAKQAKERERAQRAADKAKKAAADAAARAEQAAADAAQAAAQAEGPAEEADDAQDR